MRTFAGLVALAAALFLAPVDPAVTAPTDAGPAYLEAFTDATMRLDLYHTGSQPEVLAVARVVDDGPWPGSRTLLLDDSNLGTYLFEVADAATGRILYSRGYASLYGEWETTAEARKTKRTLQESLRFPWPKRPVEVRVKRRDRENVFQPLWTTAVDPASREVNRARPAPAGRTFPIFENGPPARKVDILVIGEGYTGAEAAKFEADVRRLVGRLFEVEPFRSRKRDFSVRALHVPSSESGIHRPQSGLFRRTPLGTQYNVFGSERYVLTYEVHALRDAASAAPYDFLEILVNDAQYGGGGIFNDHATAAAGSVWAGYLVVHEFAHHFASLADEYYTSEVAYETGARAPVEPWEPNVTALRDPKRLKWGELVEEGTPIPTPWAKEGFEAETHRFEAERRQLISRGAPSSDLDALFRRQQTWSERFLSGMPFSGRVGAFEGASYEARGLYRPTADCIMFSRREDGFCPVCRRAIERVVDRYSR